MVEAAILTCRWLGLRLILIRARHMNEAPLQQVHRFSKLGTIDLRIDYLRPGIGERFELRAEVMRLG